MDPAPSRRRLRSGGTSRPLHPPATPQPHPAARRAPRTPPASRCGARAAGMASLDSIAPAAPARGAGRAVRAFARAEHMLEIHARNRITVERHDRIGEVLALIGLDPRLDRRARAKRAPHTEG